MVSSWEPPGARVTRRSSSVRMRPSLTETSALLIAARAAPERLRLVCRSIPTTQPAFTTFTSNVAVVASGSLRLVLPSGRPPVGSMRAIMATSPRTISWAASSGAFSIRSWIIARIGSLAGEALDRFGGILGAVAGDLALTFGARGGVYVSGGIAPRIAERLAAGSFRARFEDKGRLSDYVATIPTYLVLHPYPAIVGAARQLEQMERL